MFGYDEGMCGMKWTGSNEVCGMSCKIQLGYSPRFIIRKSFLGLSTFWIDVIRGRNSCFPSRAGPCSILLALCPQRADTRAFYELQLIASLIICVSCTISAHISVSVHICCQEW